MGDALFVGRFQPFHNGHMLAIRDILEKHARVIIIIGSARQSGTAENPFSVDERIVMVKDSLMAAGIRDFEISSLEDFHDNRLWTEAITKAYRFEVAYSGNDWTVRCFREAGVRVKRHRMYDKRKYSGVAIRERIAAGKPWKDLVPPQVYGHMVRLKAEERIRRLMKDARPS